LRFTEAGVVGRGSAWFAGGSHPRHLFVADERAGYTLQPGFSGTEVAASGEFSTPVAIGADGLRRQRGVGDRADLLAVGDSMTFGEGVGEDETWSALLEAATGRRVVNAGVPGYGSRQMTERLRVELGRRSPRAVLMTLSARWDLGRCVDPFVEREGFIVASSYADRLVLVGDNLFLGYGKSPAMVRATAAATGHSALLRLLVPLLAGDETTSPRRRPRWEAYAPCLEAIDAARRETEATGAAFRLVLIDSPNDGFARDTRALRGRLVKRGVPLLALDDWIEPARREALRYAIDRHWNATGHRAVAEALRRAAPELLVPAPAPRASDVRG
jgi:hypothetical protein